MVQVFISRFSPNLENGKNVKFNIGEVVTYSRRNPVKITIKSERMHHKNAPGNGYGYEALFHDTNTLEFASELGIFDWEEKR